MKEGQEKGYWEKNLSTKLNNSNLFIFVSHVPMPIILQLHLRATREVKGLGPLRK